MPVGIKRAMPEDVFKGIEETRDKATRLGLTVEHALSGFEKACSECCRGKGGAGADAAAAHTSRQVKPPP